MLGLTLRALARLALASRVSEECDHYSKYLPSQMHQVFLRTETNSFLPQAQKFDSTKFTERTHCRKNHAKCWRSKQERKAQLPRETQKGGRYVQNYVHPRLRVKRRLTANPGWDTHKNAGWRWPSDWQISLRQGASMPIAFRLGLFGTKVCLLLRFRHVMPLPH